MCDYLLPGGYEFRLCSTTVAVLDDRLAVENVAEALQATLFTTEVAEGEEGDTLRLLAEESDQERDPVRVGHGRGRVQAGRRTQNGYGGAVRCENSTFIILSPALTFES